MRVNKDKDNGEDCVFTQLSPIAGKLSKCRREIAKIVPERIESFVTPSTPSSKFNPSAAGGTRKAALTAVQNQPSTTTRATNTRGTSKKGNTSTGFQLGAQPFHISMKNTRHKNRAIFKGSTKRRTTLPPQTSLRSSIKRATLLTTTMTICLTTTQRVLR